MSAIEVRTTQYQFSHGHTPRGRGLWAFVLRSKAGTDTFWCDGTYSECLRMARAEASRRGGVYMIEVGA